MTFDGGKTWTEVPVPNNGYVATGDPGLAFDAAGNAYMSSLGFGFGQGSPGFTNTDILVSHSTDGGKTWSDNVRVASSSGSLNSVGTFNDKDAIAAWGNRNVIVTWSLFKDIQHGAYGGSPIVDSVSHDGGRTWSKPQIISGDTASFCAGFSSPNACDQNQGSVPVAQPTEAFTSRSSTNAATRTAATTTRSSRSIPRPANASQGHFSWRSSTKGVTDYPHNAFGEPTYQDSQFRTWSFGNIAADPTHAGHLAVTWSDMRNSSVTSDDPYSTTTNSDVSVAQSFDGGHTWSTPVTLAASGDQFFPWAAYDASGLLHIGYNDRSYDPANHEFGYTLASESSWGSPALTTQQVTTVLSDPTHGDRWFSSFTPNPAFPHPSSFLGDYTMIAALPDGVVVASWADMRNNVCINGRCGAGEDAYFAAAP